MGFAAIGSLLLLIDQNHLYPCHRRDQRNTGSHHTRAQYTHGFD